MTRSATSPVRRNDAGSPGQGGAQALAGQIAALRFDAIGEHVRTVALQCVLDGLGVALAATESPAVRAVRSAIGAQQGPARLWGTGLTASARDAALVNGTAAHALDFDDVSGQMGGHPTVPVLPAVLALGEELGSSGAGLVTALVAGMETEIRVGAALGQAHYQRGFHTTATAGTLGAAAASASLLGLDAARTAVALGVAASHAAGLKALFGTMGKPLHAGKAAAAGILAARLAEAGFDTGVGSVPDALDGAQGLLAALSDDPDPAALRNPFGGPWFSPDVLFKFHASCYLTHASIEAALRLRADGLGADAVRSVELVLNPGHVGVCSIEAPRTGLEAKFSVRFATALALATGRTDEAAFTDAAVADPAVEALRSAVRTVSSDGMDRYAARISVLDRDGATWTADGDVSRPGWTTSPAEQWPRLLTKFDALTTAHPDPAALRTLLTDPDHPPAPAALAHLLVGRGGV